MKAMLQDWFKVRDELSPLKGTVLTISSFLLPLAIWAFFSYFPGLWKVSYEVITTTDLKTENFPTIYRVGHTMEKERFEAFQDSIRVKNQEIAAYQANGGDLPADIRISKRGNQKILRKIHPLAVEKGWLTESQSTDDAALYDLWKRIATGELSAGAITDENLSIIKRNWEKLSAGGASYDKETFTDQPLLHLLPIGEKAVGRPSYLPAPHECLESGIKLFQNEEDSIMARYWDSLGIVYKGFLVAVLIGLPIGLLAGTFDFFSKLFEPFVDFFRYLPAPAFGTLLVFLLGSHDAPKVALVFLGTVCQAILMTANTARQLDKGILDAAQTLGANKASLIFKVVVPGIIHNLYNDLRILLGWAWTWLVIAELMGVKSGLTEIIDTQGRRFNFDIVYAVILAIGVTGFITDQLLLRLYPTLFPWAAENSKGGLAKLWEKLRGGRDLAHSVQAKAS